MALQLDLDTTLAGTGYTATFTDAGAIAIASSSSISGGNVRQIVITLTNAVDGAAETLSVAGTLPTGITQTYNAATHQLVLSGASNLSDAAFNTALQQVRYNDTSTNPTAGNRIISVQAINISTSNGGGGGLASNVAYTTIDVTGNPVTASSFAVSTDEDSSISGDLTTHVHDINPGAS